MADILSQGYKICIPWGEDQSFDLLAYKPEENKFYRIQCKYSNRKNQVSIIMRSTNKRRVKIYTSNVVDFMAVYDNKMDKCYYIPSSKFDAYKAQITLREYTKNNQSKNINRENDFRQLKF